MALLFLAFSLIFAGAAVLISFIVDPLQHYHKSWFPPVYSSQQRYQNPGLAKHYDYDMIIIGTSMTENFVPSIVGEAFGSKVLKLSMSGSTAGEHYQIAKVALETGKVKKVLWGLDYMSLKEGVRDDQGEFPFYLYDDNFWNDYKYWFNYSVYEQLAKGLWKRAQGRAPQELEYLYNWNWFSNFSKEAVFKHYERASQEEAFFTLNEEPLDVVQNSFKTNILSLVQQYPDVEFYFYYPPYTILRQVVWRDTNEVRYANQLEMKRWMFDQFKPYPNAKVYEYQTFKDWTYNLDLFKDMSHHNQDVNTWIAETVAQDDPRFRVTEDNVDTFIQDLERQVKTVTVTPEGELRNIEIAFGSTPDELLWFSRKAIRGDELLVPSKELAEALQLQLQWDQATKTLTLAKDGRTAVMVVDSQEATVNNEPKTLPEKVILVDGKTLVPLRFLAETFGWTVELSYPDDLTSRYILNE
jgi:Copper amine oxidase N-terminal domain.